MSGLVVNQSGEATIQAYLGGDSGYCAVEMTMEGEQNDTSESGLPSGFDNATVSVDDSRWTFWLSHSLQATPWLRMIIACRTSVHTEDILGEASFKRECGKFVLMPWNVSAVDPFIRKVRCALTAGHHWH